MILLSHIIVAVISGIVGFMICCLITVGGLNER